MNYYNYVLGILVQTVNELKTLANVHDSQYVFALSRRKLGRLVLKNVPVSCIGILNYSGAEVNIT